MSVKVSITVTEGPNKGLTQELEKDELVIGRSKGDIRLKDRKVSGSHCRIFIEGSEVFAEDLGSTNGTFLGSERLSSKTPLSNLDTLTVGLSRISIAIVEDVQEFKEANTPKLEAEAPKEEQAAEPAGNQEGAEPDLPGEDAIYRTTGVRRIENLIDDEMEAFSKWDHPASAEEQPTGSSKSVPKIRVLLLARRAQEGVTQLACTAASTTIGRKGVDVRLNDLDLSRKHCAVEIVGGSKAYLRDLASTNGTYVNGQRVTYHELKAGDLVQIGQSVFEVQIQEVKK